jgi:UDP-2,3-diacylglucosamine hydrolase
MSLKNAAYFISDAHLGLSMPGRDDRDMHLRAFLSSIRESARHLFLVGDIFDFWIEYGTTVRPEYQPVLDCIHALSKSGAEVHILAGNHDFMLDRYFPDILGCQIHLSHVNIELQGKKIHIYHGDGLLKVDMLYPVFRAILRNRINQRLFKLVPMALAVGIAKTVSHTSRFITGKLMSETINTMYKDMAVKYLNSGSDMVIFGHTHTARLYEGSGKVYCNTGEWIRRMNYAKMIDGALTLWQYIPDKPPVQIPTEKL